MEITLAALKWMCDREARMNEDSWRLLGNAGERGVVGRDLRLRLISPGEGELGQWPLSSSPFGKKCR